MSNPVFILSGIVWKDKGSWKFGSTSLKESLLDFFGKKCTISLHHWPDANNNICFNSSFCSQHKENKNFLFNWKSEFVLEGLSQMPLEKLEGHHSRIILVWEDFEIPEPKLEDIEKGSLELQKLLESLKETLEVMK